MSLIQEALRRQHEDRGGARQPAQDDDKASMKLKAPGEAESEGHAAAVPPPVPGSPAPSGVLNRLPPISATSKPKTRRPVIVAGIVIIVLLAAGAAYFFAKDSIMAVIAGFHAKLQPAPAAQPTQAVSNAAPAQPAQPTLPAPAAPLFQPAQQTQAVATVAGSTGATIQIPVLPAQNPQTAQVPPEVPTAPTSTVVKPPPVKEPVIWPILTIKGILRSRSSSAVQINSTIVQEGEEILGAKVLKVGSDTVTLQYKGESRVLRTGDTTK